MMMQAADYEDDADDISDDAMYRINDAPHRGGAEGDVGGGAQVGGLKRRRRRQGHLLDHDEHGAAVAARNPRVLNKRNFSVKTNS